MKTSCSRKDHFDSSFSSPGVPSSAAIAIDGSGSASVETNSHSPLSATGAHSWVIRSRSIGRKRSMARGLKAGISSRRSRACASSVCTIRPSALRSQMVPSVTPCMSSSSIAGNENRLSRSTSLPASRSRTA